MKKIFLTIFLFTGFIACHGQPSITNISYPFSVDLFDMFEVSFNLGPYKNPYDPDTISVYAVFTGPDSRCDTVLGFYYEGYLFQQDAALGYEIAERDPDPDATGWRIRFTPYAVGRWYFRIFARDCDGVSVEPFAKPIPFSFRCQSVTEANGFISKANDRFLKREVVRNGQILNHSFFPIGPNVPWYSHLKGYGWSRPLGIYDYEKHIDSLSNNGNYMRLWLNRYQYLNLYGPEYTITPPKVYFDTTINQKDAAELDHIITYAAQNEISLMLCIFSFGDFRNSNPQEPSDPSILGNNPYNTIIDSPCDFFSDERAIKTTKNLLRYIVARWGYATNIMSWELWNEVSNMPCEDYRLFEEDVLKWHKEMSEYIREIDPFNHCISTSMVKYLDYQYLYINLYDNLDFVQQHNYQNINKAKSKEQFSYILFSQSKNAHIDYPKTPFFMGEFGFGQGSKYNSKDPYSVDLHNSLWSSLFSTSMGPASFWWWSHLDKKGLYGRFKPILTFCQNLPIPSESFEAYTTGAVSGHKLLFPNNLETYYMKNSTDDTIYGWSQDTAFCYQSLRWLTDSVIPAGQPNGLHFIDSIVFDTNGYVYKLSLDKRPEPSSNYNSIVIPIQHKPFGALYQVHWYNSETGLEYSNLVTYTTVEQTLMGRKYISILFPSSIRNLNNQTISNTFGDVAFAIYFFGYSEINKKKETTNSIF